MATASIWNLLTTLYPHPVFPISREVEKTDHLQSPIYLWVALHSAIHCNSLQIQKRRKRRKRKKNHIKLTRKWYCGAQSHRKYSFLLKTGEWYDMFRCHQANNSQAWSAEKDRTLKRESNALFQDRSLLPLTPQDHTLSDLTHAFKWWEHKDDEEEVDDYDRGEPAVSYRRTGWVWKITGWGSRLQENYRSL